MLQVNPMQLIQMIREGQNHAINMGYVSITPMTWSRTDMNVFEKLK